MALAFLLLLPLFVIFLVLVMFTALLSMPTFWLLALVGLAYVAMRAHDKAQVHHG